jgi:hypothetical protein
MARRPKLALVALALIAWTTGSTAQNNGRPLALNGGDQLLYIGTYAGRIDIIDEGTEKRVGEIPLKTGIPRDLWLSQDRTKFYVLDATYEQIEVIDIASRASLGQFRLSEGNKKVRIRAMQVDPLERFVILLTRAATKQVDRWEIGDAELLQYDLKAHKVVRTIPWPRGEQREFVNLQFSPDGKLLYFFGDDVLILETENFKEVDTWELSRPLEAGLGRVNLGPADDLYEDPGFFTGLFTIQDPVQNRRIMGIGRVNLVGKSIDFTAIGPAQNIGFALAPGRKRGYGLMQQIGRYEIWTFDLEQKKVLSRLEFKGRPRMAIRVSSNGRLLYIYQAGATIDVHEAATFKRLRTIQMDADQTTDLFVLPKPGGAKPTAE